MEMRRNPSPTSMEIFTCWNHQRSVLCCHAIELHIIMWLHRKLQPLTVKMLIDFMVYIKISSHIAWLPRPFSSILNDSICNYPLSFQSRSPWFESRLYSNLEMAHIRVDTQNLDPKQFKSFCCFQVAVYLETILKHLLLKNILSALLAIYDITVREYTISVSLMCYRIPAVRLQ